MKKVLIAGASTYGVKNMGDDAMLWNMVEGFRREWPGCQQTFLARHPDAEFDRFFGIRSIKNIDHDSKAQSIGRFFYGFNRGDSTAHLARIRQAMEESDLVVIGGNSFMEISAADFLRGVPTYSSLLAQWTKLFGKPYALYGVAVHPIHNEYTKQAARFLCHNAQIVTLREEASRENLRAAGVVSDNMVIQQDPAYGVDPVRDKAAALEILRRENIVLPDKPVIGIGFRHMYWKWSEDETAQYVQKMAQVCDAVVDLTDGELLFIPNCTYNIDTPNEDDRVMTARIRNLMRHRAKAHEIRGDYNLRQTVSLFQLLSLHISNRRHSSIFAAIHHVPIVALATGHIWHFQPFMAELGLPEYVADFMTEDVATLAGRIGKAWQARGAISATLQRALPPLRDMARGHVKAIVASLSA